MHFSRLLGFYYSVCVLSEEKLTLWSFCCGQGEQHRPHKSAPSHFFFGKQQTKTDVVFPSTHTTVRRFSPCSISADRCNMSWHQTALWPGCCFLARLNPTYLWRRCKRSPQWDLTKQPELLCRLHCTLLHEEKGSRVKKGRAYMSSLVVLGQLSCPPHTPDLPELYPSLCSPLPLPSNKNKLDWIWWGRHKFHSNELSPEARCRIKMNCGPLSCTFIFL